MAKKKAVKDIGVLEIAILELTNRVGVLEHKVFEYKDNQEATVPEVLERIAKEMIYRGSQSATTVVLADLAEKLRVIARELHQER